MCAASVAQSTAYKRCSPFVVATEHVVIVQIFHVLPVKPFILVENRTER